MNSFESISSSPRQSKFKEVYNKMHGKGSPLKEKLREQCMNRIKEEREDLLRQARKGSNFQDKIKKMVDSEYTSIIQQGLSSSPPSSQSNTNTPNNAPVFPTSDFFEDTLTPDEYVDVMRMLEQEILDELAKEEEAKIRQYYEETKSYEDRLLQTTINSHFTNTIHSPSSSPALESTKGDVVVPCPVCKKHKLLKTGRSIICACGLRIDLHDENIGLDYLQKCLSECWIQHSQNCLHEPIFDVQTNDKLGFTGILMVCDHCDCFQIVL